MKMLKFLLCGLLMAVPVFAEEADDRQTATSLHYVSHELDTRQDKLSAGTNAALTYTNAAGNVEQRTVKSDLTGGTTDTSLPQVNAVNAGLNTKQDDITAINDHTAVTYTGQTGQIGQKGIYQTDGTYAEQSDNLIDAKTFNTALKNALDSEFVCADRPDAYDPNTNLCWLWQIHNDSNSINLFDITTATRYNARWDSNGHWLPQNQASVAQTYGTTVSPNTTYTISKVGGNRLCITCFIQITIPVSETNIIPDYIIRGSTNDFATGNYTFTTPENCNWLLFSVKNSSANVPDATNIQIEKGSTATPYQPYGNVYIPQNQ